MEVPGASVIHLNATHKKELGDRRPATTTTTTTATATTTTTREAVTAAAAANATMIVRIRN